MDANDVEYRKWLGMMALIGVNTDDQNQMMAVGKGSGAAKFLMLAGIGISVVGVITLVFFVGFLLLPLGLWIIYQSRVMSKRAKLRDFHFQVKGWPA